MWLPGNAVRSKDQTATDLVRPAGFEPATRCLEGTSCFPGYYLAKYLTAKWFRVCEMLTSSVSIDFEAASPALAKLVDLSAVNRSCRGVTGVITYGGFRPIYERA